MLDEAVEEAVVEEAVEVAEEPEIEEEVVEVEENLLNRKRLLNTKILKI